MVLEFEVEVGGGEDTGCEGELKAMEAGRVFFFTAGDAVSVCKKFVLGGGFGA